MHPSSSLATQLQSALASRDERWIRRRLPDPHTSSPSSPLIDFNSNDYLSLARSPHLRSRFLHKLAHAPQVLGSGGSRLLVNGHAHSNLESRLAGFFRAGAALLFNSGFDANAGLFACVPQPRDVLVLDEHVHASVHDGVRASRVPRAARRVFAHNEVADLRRVLAELVAEDGGRDGGLRSGERSVFVAVESLYSMDGTFAPLVEIVEVLEEVFPARNGYLIVDEAHATGLYGPQGRGRVAELGLEDRVLARLHTFGKALAATGAVILTNTLIRDYLLNYARPLIYTTSLSYANIIAADCSFDMLCDGTAEEVCKPRLLPISHLYLLTQITSTQQLSRALLDLSTHFTTYLHPRLALAHIPKRLLSLPEHLTPPSHSHTRAPAPSPIIPLMTAHPRPLSAYLLALGMNARPITWPTVPKGRDRVRVCLHAANTREEVERLAEGAVRWAEEVLRAERRGAGGAGEGVWERERESKL
ncbi:hypothetical protein H0H81_004383 [Sphagnurus paluster]|uniref:Aminotransferase class I/classII large domain-containing protein n=1 Tax=Sphagnurus paluster TaxID=117069 RepID=A0A9P7KHF6_9AGAR|nr:hypothetical protein H0H81_004383 [Sphagnurus paluster]